MGSPGYFTPISRSYFTPTYVTGFPGGRPTLRDDGPSARYISADVKVTEPSTEITGNRLSYGQIDADEKCLRPGYTPEIEHKQNSHNLKPIDFELLNFDGVCLGIFCECWFFRFAGVAISPPFGGL